MPQHLCDLGLCQLLREKDPSLAAQLDRIKQRGLDDWMSLLMPDKGSHAGYPHLENVERAADRIVPNPLKNDLTPAELFLLLSAIYLHDIGRVFPSAEKLPCGIEPSVQCPSDSGKTVKPPARATLERAVPAPCSKPQWDHHRKGERIIHKEGVSLGLPDERLAHYCALLVLCHGLPKPPDAEQRYFAKCENPATRELHRDDFRYTSLVPYGTIRLPLLAAILRVADETDNSWARAVRESWFTSPQLVSGELAKGFRRYIEDVEFCHEGECLVVHVAGLPDAASPSGGLLFDQAIKSINGARRGMARVISGRWGEILRRHGIVFNAVYIEHDGRIYDRLKKTWDGQSLRPRPLGNAVGVRVRPSLERLFEAATKLALGGYYHGRYSWESLEAQVGWPLAGPERWLALRMTGVTDCFGILADPDGDGLHIELKFRPAVPFIRRALFGAKASGLGADEECCVAACAQHDSCPQARRCRPPEGRIGS